MRVLSRRIESTVSFPAPCRNTGERATNDTPAKNYPAIAIGEIIAQEAATGFAGGSDRRARVRRDLGLGEARREAKFSAA